jgi:membrane fusion protein, hemolysin D
MSVTERAGVAHPAPGGQDATGARETKEPALDSGLLALCGVAAYFHVVADPAGLRRDLGLVDRKAEESDLLRAAQSIGLEARILDSVDAARLEEAPSPAIARLRNGKFVVFGGRLHDAKYRIVDLETRESRDLSVEEYFSIAEPRLVVVVRASGVGIDPRSVLSAFRSVDRALPQTRIGSRIAAAFARVKKGLAERDLLKEQHSDKEFLPAALEILETPPSPIHIGFMLTICGFVVVALLWSFFGRIDIVAVAQGKIQPAGRIKVVQPVETGKVTGIHVENGSVVKAGDLLVELDPSEARAEEAASEAAYLSYKAEALRRRAALLAAEAKNFQAPPKINWPAAVPNVYRLREERVLKGDFAQLEATVSSLGAQILQKQAESQRLEQTIAAQESLVETLKQRVAMRESLLKQRAGTKSALIDAQETLQYHQTNLATQKGQVAELAANLKVLQHEKEKAIETFVSDNGQKLLEVERQADEAEQKLAKARVRVAHTRLTAPISGTVFGSSVTTTGQVVTASEEVMRIVPSGSSLEIEAYLENKDIGFVAVGQSAVVKVESFPFIRYGSIDATVTRVSRDAIPEPDVQAQEGSPTRQSKSAALGGGQRVQNLMFPVTLKPETLAIKADNKDYPLSPGMAVTVEIKTGSRRILEYVFSPLVETASTSMKER